MMKIYAPEKARAMRAAPEYTLVIEDSINGLTAARAAGAGSAFVRDIPDYPEETLRNVSKKYRESGKSVKNPIDGTETR